jgi:hypothetical protein
MSHVHLSGFIIEHITQNDSSNTCGWEQEGRKEKQNEIIMAERNCKIKET